MTPRPEPAARPADHRNPWLLTLVLIGGAAGTAVRAALETTFPRVGVAWPWTTFAINLTGAFLLGVLLQALPPGRGMPRLRLVLGTGFLGGFTTYSTFAVEVVSSSPAVGLGYALASAMGGVAAAALGLTFSRTVRAASTGRSIRDAPGGGR